MYVISIYCVRTWYLIQIQCKTAGDDIGLSCLNPCPYVSKICGLTVRSSPKLDGKIMSFHTDSNKVQATLLSTMVTPGSQS